MNSELNLQQIPEFHRPPISWFCKLMTLGLHEFATSKLRRFEIPDLRTFATLELCRFKIPDLRKFDIPKNLFHEFHKPRHFKGDRFS
jgi:hypothetical protein